MSTVESTEDAVVEELRQRGVVAVVRAATPELAVTASRALGDGGITAIEVTYTVPDAAAAIAELARDERLLVGAGTITTEAQAREAVAAGARYLVSPHRCDAAIDVAEEAGIPAIPGVYTPTEIVEAATRCRLLKLFPANLGGVDLLKTLRGPFPTLSFMPSGGVSADNVGQWLAAGAVALGAGSSLAPSDAVAAGDAEAVTRSARRWSEALAAARAASGARTR
jgi:2-dehydro-3-deoxyphosphogluconate aldolase/(4S)-4-hydroxy-2-oxoglutarate aldolase